MATISLLLICVGFSDIDTNYYSEQSWRIAAVQPSELCMSGDSLQIALNRIARANYKHRNFRRAYKIAGMIQPGDHDKLRWDTISLRALLAKNVGKFGEADSLYEIIFAGSLPYPDILFEAHLNNAELKRLQLDYTGRQRHLLQALAYAEGWRHNKVIRVLTRHYFNVLRDFEQAERILAEHGEPVNAEDRAGYMLVQAEFAEAQQQYRRAMRYYRRAQQVAKRAGFVTFMYDASDGYMRANVSLEDTRDQRLQWYVINGILLAIFFGVWWYNRN